MSLSLNQFLVLYMWFALAALLLFIVLIARFYEKFSDERTYYRLYGVPLVLFGAGVVRYASVDYILGDAFADLMFGLAGVILFLLSVRLYWLMIIQRQRE
ncbi:MAG: hypothetical protein ACOCX5_01805 [Chloroflexota bacterium]